VDPVPSSCDEASNSGTSFLFLHSLHSLPKLLVGRSPSGLPAYRNVPNLTIIFFRNILRSLLPETLFPSFAPRTFFLVFLWRVQLARSLATLFRSLLDPFSSPCFHSCYAHAQSLTVLILTRLISVVDFVLIGRVTVFVSTLFTSP